MTGYRRVLPRDLFNEASLLKCLGRLVILLGETHDHAAGFEEEELPFFDIVQDYHSGAIGVANLTFTIGGVRHRLLRPLNSRDTWPLWVEESDNDPDFDPVKVFDDDGNFSADMLRLIRQTI